MGKVMTMPQQAMTQGTRETVVIVPNSGKRLPKVHAVQDRDVPLPQLRLKAVQLKRRRLRFSHAQKRTTVILADHAHRVIKVAQVTTKGKFVLPLSKAQLRLVVGDVFYVTAIVAHCPAVTVKYVLASTINQEVES